MLKRFTTIILTLAIINAAGNLYAEWISYTTENSDIAGNEIYTITEDTEGNMWIGTKENGISVLDRSGNWTQYNQDNSALESNSIYSIAVSTDGAVWVGTFGGGIAKYGSSGWTVYNSTNIIPHNDIVSISIDDQDVKWFASYGGGLYRFDNSTWTIYTKDNSGLTTDFLYGVDSGIDDKIWIAAYNNGLYRFDNGKSLGNGQWTHITTSDGLASNYIWTVRTEPSDKIKWVGTRGIGLNRLDSENSISLYDSNNSDISDKNIRSIDIDRSGTLWIGTLGGGVNRFDGTTWLIYDTVNSKLLSNYVNAVFIDSSDGRWFGTNKGVSRFIEREIPVASGKTAIQGGQEGYVNPSKNEKATIFFYASEAGKVKIRIYTPGGRLVWKTEKYTEGTSKDYVVWDCINESEDTVSSGIYVVYIEGPGINSIKKIPVIR